MNSQKHINWEDSFRQGINVIRPIIPTVISYCRSSTITYLDYAQDYENICLSERFNIAPKFINAGIHKANRLFKYYTYKQLPGAVIFLGCK